MVTILSTEYTPPPHLTVCLSAHVCSGVSADTWRGAHIYDPPSCSHLRRHLPAHTPCAVSPEQKLVPPLAGPFGHVLEDKRRAWRCERASGSSDPQRKRSPQADEDV